MKKSEKMKKAFCLDICACHSLWQNLSMPDLRIASVNSVEKRELQEPQLQKIFLRFPFFTSVTSAKLKADVDKFCLRRGKHKYGNKILQHCNEVCVQFSKFQVTKAAPC